ncbi:CENP-B protein [Choiromyces venosus 120613-1]|uniref:CENP-B protein n=1 Tax=Choiromyces venosus 120613-1 TaxID=1336337 RepID=A0A3N4JWQ5_9PEZI|nr:CENP-B protein [Choiromyces venosus 120613-1]
MGLIASEKVIDIFDKPQKDGKLFVSHPGNRELATVVEAICVDGSVLDLMIIFKVKDFREEWFEDLPDVPNNILFGQYPNGWTGEQVALHWLGENFGPSSQSAKKAGVRYRILLFDGHNSHVNINFLEYCIKNRVIPICLPPRTSHRLQPLNISVFSPYKRAY